MTRSDGSILAHRSHLMTVVEAGAATPAAEAAVRTRAWASASSWVAVSNSTSAAEGAIFVVSVFFRIGPAKKENTVKGGFARLLDLRKARQGAVNLVLRFPLSPHTVGLVLVVVNTGGGITVC